MVSAGFRGPRCPADPDHGTPSTAALYMREYNRRPEVRERDRARTRDREAQAAQARIYRRTTGRARIAWSNASHIADGFGVANDAALATFEDLLGRPCIYCGRTPANGVDHVVPMSRGGGNVADNLVPSCLPCNRSKSARPLVRALLDLCPRGHDYATNAGTFTYHKGRRSGQVVRFCMPCRNDRRRAAYAASRAA